MSKPKHFMRGQSRLARYGYKLSDANARKGALLYWMNLSNEIEELKFRGPRIEKHVAKLRRYWERTR